MNRFLVALLALLTGATLLTVFPTYEGSESPQRVSVKPGVLPAAPKNWTALFGGDVMVGRSVDSRIEQYGAAWPFGKIATLIRSADFAAVNLESPILVNGSTTSLDSLILRGNPKAVPAMTEAGIDFVSLANNHIPDKGYLGLSDTIRLLRANEIGFAGAGESDDAAYQPFITKVGEIKIGVLGYTYGVNFSSSGVFVAKTTNSRTLGDIKELKSKVDLVIVYAHFGTEYASKPSQSQVDFAHGAVNAGATIVVGAHPHVSQKIERYNDGLIAYSLGNLVFDQAPGQNRDHSALLQVSFTDNKLSQIELIPYHIFNLGQPTPIETGSSEAKSIYSLFGLESNKLVL